MSAPNTPSIRPTVNPVWTKVQYYPSQNTEVTNTNPGGLNTITYIIICIVGVTAIFAILVSLLHHALRDGDKPKKNHVKSLPKKSNLSKDSVCGKTQLQLITQYPPKLLGTSNCPLCLQRSVQCPVSFHTHGVDVK